jgi:hypothetical protein
MHSSLSGLSNRQFGRSVGVDEYMPKFEPEKLAGTLERILAWEQWKWAWILPLLRALPGPRRRDNDYECNEAKSLYFKALALRATGWAPY